MRGALQWTPHRQRALTLLLDGKTYREIADEMRISPPTARKHIEAVLMLSGVSSRSELQAREIARLRGQMQLMQWRAA